MQRAIPCSILRGGTSKGLFFHARDLPSDDAMRDVVLLAAMGSPDPRQIDGLGGSHPLTSKVALISPPSRPDADVDYLFLQVVVNEARVDRSQNCGNILAGVGPFSIEERVVTARDGITDVRIHMVNSGSIAVARVQTPGTIVSYEGDARIDGVPGSHAPIPIEFLDVAGSSCGALLPTGHVYDPIDGVRCTLVDNGMPVVVILSSDLGKSGGETPAELESDEALKQRVESIRLQAGRMMNLGDVAKKTVPKVSLVSPARNGGAINTRTFIPHRVHEAIGVFGAVSVATACALPGSLAHEIAVVKDGDGPQILAVEHPTGFFSVDIEVERLFSGITVRRAALLRTARYLMKGTVLVPARVWPP